MDLPADDQQFILSIEVYSVKLQLQSNKLLISEALNCVPSLWSFISLTEPMVLIVCSFVSPGNEFPYCRHYVCVPLSSP